MVRSTNQLKSYRTVHRHFATIFIYQFCFLKITKGNSGCQRQQTKKTFFTRELRQIKSEIH